MTAIQVQDQLDKPKPKRKREWAPRIWEGCDGFAWISLLIRNRFAVHWRYWYIAITITIVSVIHTLLRYLQTILYWRSIRRTTVKHAPIFIIGHWRTGTTLLHELLILDDRHTFPNTYECFEPNHFLLTEWLFTRFFRFLLPDRRPMDNMAAGWERPQEDEFALCMLGEKSPYLTIAFPNHGPQCEEYLDLKSLSNSQLNSWKNSFFHFIRSLTVKDPRRLVLKSPPHSCRSKVLLELFPDARFVHIMRDPYVVFPSTVNLWKSLYRTHGLQMPTYQGLEEHVLTTLPRIYAGVDEARRLVDPRRFYELHYEDLIANPTEQMRTLYEHLQLGEFESVLPRLEAYFASSQDYQTNRYELAAHWKREITRRWGAIIRQYGYDVLPDEQQ